MKLRYIFLVSAIVLGLASCEYNSEIDDLEGVFDAPTTAELSLSSYSSELDGKLRYFTLDFSSSSVSLHTVLVGTSSNPYLPSNGYTEAYSSDANNGYFIIEDTYVTDGGSAKTITDGTITVSQSSTETADVYAYTLSAVIFAEDGDAYKLSWEGEMTWEGDPAAIELTQVLSATNWLAYGYGNYLSISLATEDISSEFSWTTYTTTYSGTGYMLSIDIYSEDGYLHEGTYSPSSAGGSVEEGTYGIGYTYSYYGTDYDYGTTWFTITDGSLSAQYITEGDLVVTRTSSGWNISYDNGDIWCEFDGAIDDLTDPDDSYSGSDAEADLTECIYASSNVGYGTYSVTMYLATEDVTYSYDSATYTATYTGPGNWLALDLYSSDGYIHEGTYTACSTGGSIGENEFGIGYDAEYWGYTYENWGTVWWTVDDDGNTTGEKVTDGTLTVERVSAGWRITLTSSTVNTIFEGAIDDLTDPDDIYTGTYELTNLLTYTDYYTTYLTYGMEVHLYGLELGTSEMSYSYDSDTWTATYSGSGNVLKVEVYTAEGGLDEGTYTPCTTAGSPAEGEFGIGYDGTYGVSGTVWYTYEDGTATSYQYITDGTVTVEDNNDGTYTITVESSVVNATWTGAIE